MMVHIFSATMKTILLSAIWVLLITRSYSAVIMDNDAVIGDVLKSKDGAATSQPGTGVDQKHMQEGHESADENTINYEDPFWIVAVTVGAICGFLGMILSLYMAYNYVKRNYNNRYGALHVSNPQTIKPV